MEAQSRLRPSSLQTGWTDHGSHYSRGSASSARWSPYSPSTRSPGAPSPMYPRFPGFDSSMRQHERTMVDSFDSRERRASHDTRRSSHQSLTPMAEEHWAQRRASYVASPASPRAPAPSPVAGPTHGMPIYRPRNQTLAADARSILAAGAPPAALTSPQTSATDRRSSLPTNFSSHRAVQDKRRELQSRGSIFLRIAAEPSISVTAVPLQRRSESAPADKNPVSPRTEGTGRREGDDSEVTIRARVLPSDRNKDPFFLTKSFNLKALRASALGPVLSASSKDPRRLSTDSEAEISAWSRRVSSASDASMSTDQLNQRATVHLCYATAYLPILGALMLTPHVHHHDALEITLPHPHAWKRTVEYVYASQGELTEAMKENIEHLGGTVEEYPGRV